jgi:hypothetical protein
MTALTIQTKAQEKMLDAMDDLSNYRISFPRAIATHIFFFTVGLIAALVRRD